MKNIYVYCEGQTEESFIREVLYPYFLELGIVLFPIVCATKRTQTKKFRGGVSDYTKIKKELTVLCRSHKNEHITTLFDYYAMPENTPNIDCDDPDIFKRMESIEASINADVGERNCSFHFALHEFEGLLFSDPKAFSVAVDEEVVAQLQQIRDAYPTPEHINNSLDSAPSKHLERLIPNYAKIRNGTLISKQIGISKLMSQCPHFRQWIESLREMA